MILFAFLFSEKVNMTKITINIMQDILHEDFVSSIQAKRIEFTVNSYLCIVANLKYIIMRCYVKNKIM